MTSRRRDLNNHATTASLRPRPSCKRILIIILFVLFYLMHPRYLQSFRLELVLLLLLLPTICIHFKILSLYSRRDAIVIKKDSISFCRRKYYNLLYDYEAIHNKWV